MTINDSSIWLHAGNSHKKGPEQRPDIHYLGSSRSNSFLPRKTLSRWRSRIKFFNEMLLDAMLTYQLKCSQNRAGREIAYRFFPERIAGRGQKEAPTSEAQITQNKAFWPLRAKSRIGQKDSAEPQNTHLESFCRSGPSNRFAHAVSTAVCDSPAKAYNLYLYTAESALV